jgi:hypothetical protein
MLDDPRAKGENVRLFRVTLLTLLLTALIGPSAAGATEPPLDVEIVAPTSFVEPGLPDGTFTTSGPALDDGLICSTGVTYPLETWATGLQSDRLANFHVLKEFVCDDDSGSFFVKLEAHWHFAKTFEYNEFTWTIQGGTGEYQGLHGSGSGMGNYLSPEVVLDVYTGRAH